MCDTFVCPPAQSASGNMIFGKNSDREPNEAQQIVSIKGYTSPLKKVLCTYISIPAPLLQYEVILSKPFQMWGAEMGVNEKGLAIGNEAVFTKIPFLRKNTGLTGMDLIRLALQSCTTALEAAKFISKLIETYGQDACGGYTDKGFYYHNSFMIADPNEAYVLDTAGHFWVLEKVSSYRAISNGLSVEKEYVAIHKSAIQYARTKGWTSPNRDFSFKEAFSAFWMPKLAKCEFRRSLSESNAKPNFTVNDSFSVLRSHSQEDFSPENGETNSLCMHASGLLCPHQSTGSMVAELRENALSTVWLTGSSAPCLSIFKPFYFGNKILSSENFPLPGAKPDNSYWWRWEAFHRMSLKDYNAIHHLIQNDQSLLENQWLKEDALAFSNSTQRNELSQTALRQSEETLSKWLQYSPQKDTRGFLYKRFWSQQERA
jgi:dipeptidase